MLRDHCKIPHRSGPSWRTVRLLSISQLGNDAFVSLSAFRQSIITCLRVTETFAQRVITSFCRLETAVEIQDLPLPLVHVRSEVNAERASVRTA